MWPIPSIRQRAELSRTAPLAATLRFTLGPVLFLDATDGATSPWFLVGLVMAFLSDIFDGVIARRLGVVSTRLRMPADPR